MSTMFATNSAYNDNNVYIANMPHNYGKDRLHILLSPYGKITRHTFVSPETPSQPGYGFVQFATNQQAENAITQMQNYTFSNGQTIYISFAMHRRSTLSDEPTNLYVKHVPELWTNETLHTIFRKYGRIESVKCVGKGIAFVRYEDHNQALNAIDHLNGAEINSLFPKTEQKSETDLKSAEIVCLGVEFATRKSAATAYQLQSIPKSKENKHNLYVRNLPRFYTQKQLEQLFCRFGKICAAKINDGIAFVRFVHAKDALSAIETLNGTRPKGFSAEIVVKLAHFDIGDVRNRWNTKSVKEFNDKIEKNDTVSKKQMPSAQNGIQNLGMVNMANAYVASMLIDMNLSSVPLVQPNQFMFAAPPLQLNLMPQYPIHNGINGHMTYVNPFSNLLTVSMPQMSMPQITVPLSVPNLNVGHSTKSQ